MATLQLIHGSTTIDLNSASGLRWLRGGITGGAIKSLNKAHSVSESYVLKLTSTTQDAAAASLQSLMKVLKAVDDYKDSIWSTKPVYLKAQTTNETNARYAQVWSIDVVQPPETLGNDFDLNTVLMDLRIDLTRENPWRSAVPGTLGSAKTLTATDGPASPTMVQLANFRDDIVLTTVLHYDSSLTSYSGNLLSAASGTALFPAAPGVDDLFYVFSAGPFKHVEVGITTAGVYNWAIQWEYYDGSAWQSLAYGTDITCFSENGGEVTVNELFKYTGQWSINLFPPSDWATNATFSNAYGIRAHLTTVTSTTTVPEKDGTTIYAQRTNYFEIPASVIAGDSPPTLAFRAWAPSGGDENEGPANISRIIMGAKSRGIDGSADQFCYSLNAGTASNPSAWAVSYGTDASGTADVQSPGGRRCSVSFATDTTSQVRVTMTGTAVMSKWTGEYLPMLRVQQIGGAAGDTSVSIASFAGGSGASDPNVPSPEIALRGADAGPEVVTFPLLRLPPSRVYDADALASMDLIFKIYASRATGSSTLRVYDLLLMPVDEGVVGMDDAALDTTNGNGALRGGALLDLDAGLIADRTIKQVVDSSGNIKPVGAWARMNRPIPFENLATKHRIYALMLCYPSSWGGEPLTAPLGMQLAIEVFAHTRYALLRGSG